MTFIRISETSRKHAYIYIYIYAEKSSINLGHDNSFFKERSGREGMAVVSVLLGAAVEVGVSSNPTIAK